MIEREKEYVCDKLCRYPYICDDIDDLDRICETCMLNKTRSQKRKEYMQEYYLTKIKPARMQEKLNREYGITHCKIVPDPRDGWRLEGGEPK